MRTATIRIERDDTAAMTDASRQFLDAWSTAMAAGKEASAEFVVSPARLVRRR